MGKLEKIKSKYRGVIYTDGSVFQDEMEKVEENINEDTDIDEAKLLKRLKEAEEFINGNKIIKLEATK